MLYVLVAPCRGRRLRHAAPACSSSALTQPDQRDSGDSHYTSPPLLSFILYWRPVYTVHRARKSAVAIVSLNGADTKEAGFVDAIVAAGVVYALTEACSQGRLLDCQCRRRHNAVDRLGTQHHTGCDHYVDFGYHKSRDFMNRKRVGDLRATILSHNYEAGRQVTSLPFLFLFLCQFTESVA